VAEDVTANTFPVYIGYNYPGYAQPFLGLIDEVRIWSSALTASQLDDMTPPVITITTPDNGATYLLNQIVNADWSASDGTGTGVRSKDGTVPSGLPINTATVGSKDFTVTATDYAMNTDSKTVTYNVVDTTPPVITLLGVTPVTIEVGSVYVDAGATALDNYDGVITGSIVTVNPVNTAVVGIYTVTYNVTDAALNPAVQVTRTVNVVYKFGGILPPINSDGSSIFKLGSTVPVKFQLTDADGNFVTNAVATIWVKKLSNGVLPGEMEAVSTSAATTGNLFRYDSTSNQYIFNLATKLLSKGNWRITIDLGDGTLNYVNINLK